MLNSFGVGLFEGEDLLCGCLGVWLDVFDTDTPFVAPYFSLE